MTAVLEPRNGARLRHNFLVHRHRDALALRLLHNEDKWQHANEDDHHESEGVVEREHVGLAIYHASKSGVGLARGCGWITAPAYKAGDQRTNHSLSRLIVRSNVRTQNIDVGLLMSCQDRGHAGDPDARTDVAHEIKETSRIADLFLRNRIVGDGGKRDEEQPHCGSLDNQRNKEVPIAGVQAEM